MHGTQSWHHLSNWNFTQNAVSHNDVPDLIWYDAGYNFRNVGLYAKTWHCKTYLETKPLHLQTVMRQGCIEISVHIPDFAGPIWATLDGTGSTKTGTIEATRFWASGTWRPISVSHAPMATCHNMAVAGPRWRRASDNVRIVIDSEQPLTAIKACSQRTSWTKPSLKCFIFPFYFRAPFPPPYRTLSFFSFRFHYMDFPDCLGLLLLLSTSVYLLFSFFSVFTLF